jgi:hypothetical protein
VCFLQRAKLFKYIKISSLLKIKTKHTHTHTHRVCYEINSGYEFQENYRCLFEAAAVFAGFSAEVTFLKPGVI